MHSVSSSSTVFLTPDGSSVNNNQDLRQDSVVFPAKTAVISTMEPLSIAPTPPPEHIQCTAKLESATEICADPNQNVPGIHKDDVMLSSETHYSSTPAKTIVPSPPTLPPGFRPRGRKAQMTVTTPKCRKCRKERKACRCPVPSSRPSAPSSRPPPPPPPPSRPSRSAARG